MKIDLDWTCDRGCSWPSVAPEPRVVYRTHTLQNLRRELLRVLTTRHMVQPQAAARTVGGRQGPAARRRGGEYARGRFLSCRSKWRCKLVSQLHATVLRCVLKKGYVHPAATTITTLSFPSLARGSLSTAAARGTPPRPASMGKRKEKKRTAKGVAYVFFSYKRKNLT